MDLSYNQLNSNRFTFSFGKIPEASFCATDVNLPKISVEPALAGWSGVESHVPGETIKHSPLVVKFSVDEDLINYLELYNWFSELYYEKRDTPKDLLKNLVSDATLIILTNGSNPNIRVKFQGVFPIEISEINFTTQSSPQPIFCSVTFMYTKFEIEKVNQ